ncbi:MAG: acyl-CoA dehydrogenase family protein [Deltaproteobacteria bacterium]|nr:acyl-CoA dehydrogenase family protein [Deltaproteobacteria bacterium]MBW1923844.1 acyl-CoA dehydrogenase family protein [Deltaproteobacteria bacterium]MBW1949698.1 acyl-CoA dehydrogenase family protein [Deltaproteobacteria bacterium]MBW2009158.1 acyl-CoA dehydrogenase family protein [Deltaproteobacteria bacterium]MBW2103082.1 acyl-CoA dehydrogenase family protein [Deltaproteobacteria bacterium]
MDFSFSEEHLLIQESIRKFCRKELDPIAAEIDREERFPMEVYRKLGQEGFLGIMVPEEYGGSGSDLMSMYIVKEELCRAAGGMGMSVNICTLNFLHFISRFGTEEQKRTYIPPVLRGEALAAYALTEPGAGSDTLGMQTRAVRKGDKYRIRGTKTFVTNAPLAQYFLVVTRTSGERSVDGGTNFILERGMEGLSTGKPFEKLGMRCSPTGEVFMEDVEAEESRILGAPDRGFHDMFTTLNAERALGAATATGVAQACFDAAVKYAGQRVQFKRPIGSFQFVQGMLAEMATNLAVARTYAHHVVWLYDQGRPIRHEASMAKLFASQMAVKCALDAVQIHGGYGYIKEFPVERYLRDAKLGEIGGGTSEIQKLIIGRQLMQGVAG